MTVGSAAKIAQAQVHIHRQALQVLRRLTLLRRRRLIQVQVLQVVQVIRPRLLQVMIAVMIPIVLEHYVQYLQIGLLMEATGLTLMIARYMLRRLMMAAG